MKKPRWTEEEDQKLRDWYAKVGMPEVAKEFPERTLSAVRNRIHLLRLVRRRYETI
jgi:hypothetical protein